jgi:hypothetical protein
VLAVRKANVVIVIVVGWLSCALAPVGCIGCGSGDDIGCGGGDVFGCVGNWMVGREWVFCSRARRDGNSKVDSELVEFGGGALVGENGSGSGKLVASEGVKLDAICSS